MVVPVLAKEVGTRRGAASPVLSCLPPALLHILAGECRRKARSNHRSSLLGASGQLSRARAVLTQGASPVSQSLNPHAEEYS